MATSGKPPAPRLLPLVATGLALLVLGAVPSAGSPSALPAAPAVGEVPVQSAPPSTAEAEGTEPPDAGAPAPAPTSTPPPPPESPAASGRTVTVSTADELSAALAAARPGQTIRLSDGAYTGKFVAAASGTDAAPITLTGSRAAVLSSGSLESGYGLHITGSYWQVSGLSVAQSAKGIVLDGSAGTVLSNVDVGSIGSEAVHFRANSTDCTIRDSEIHDTGLAKPGFGEGIYVGSAKSNWKSVMGSAATPDRSDRVVISNNRVSRTAAEGIDIKEGTTGGKVTGNSFSEAGFSGANSADSWVDVKGNGYTVSGNSGSTTKLDALQVHNVLDGWGRDNAFAGNTVLGGVPGYEVRIQSENLGNTVRCQASAAGRGLTNIACTL